MHGGFFCSMPVKIKRTFLTKKHTFFIIPAMAYFLFAEYIMQRTQFNCRKTVIYGRLMQRELI